ncbi:hypothetical protein D9Q98_003012 [Chlorella vulgaris]|uniref:Uncharacterized protein n=1 Tax=Chlorella vulgaris TaxID=3077 RepID=A0A9D4TUD5_CHLVU|nr:hypothetical protein D9Q98_003012 [Chlorella vulgaris]
MSQIGMEWQLDVELPAHPKTHIEETYNCCYKLVENGNDLSYRLHPNGLCLIGLAPEHAALRIKGGGGESQPGQPPALSTAGPGADSASAGSVPQDGSQPAQLAGGDAANQQQQDGAALSEAAAQRREGNDARLVLTEKLVQAEFRKGRGPLLQVESVLGRLFCGGTEHVLRCGVRGLLVELNTQLPDARGRELLSALEDGYLAILDVKAAEAQQLLQGCLTLDQYMQQRQELAKEPAESAPL